MLRPHPGASLILIAERDQKVRELQRYFLGNAGFAVQFADDGATALEQARLTKPAVVVTEILLPKIDGLELCRRLGEDSITQHIPVVVFSILAAAVRAGEAGAKAFLRKPLVESIFVATVRDLVAATPAGTKEKQWASQ